MKDMIEKDDYTLEDALSDLFRPVYFDHKQGSMKTDIKEDDDKYELDVDMPGFAKDEINVSLDNGYLNVSAKKVQKQENADEKKHNFIRRERSYACQRSYYVGDKVEKDGVKAKYENGVLNLIVPKQKPKELPEHKIHID